MEGFRLQTSGFRYGSNRNSSGPRQSPATALAGPLGIGHLAIGIWFSSSTIATVTQLFDNPPSLPDAPSNEDCLTVSLAINANLWRTFDYLWPANLGVPQRGQRVRVPFGRGNRTTLAFVVDVGGQPPAGRQLKAVAEVVDPQPQLDETLWKLGNWISHYYLTPLGMTLAAMVPSAVGKHGPRVEAVALLSSHHADWPTSLGARQKRVLDELFEAKKQGIEPLTVEQLLHHSGAGRDSLKRLSGRGLIRLETRPVVLPELNGAADTGDQFDLNEDQQSVMSAVDKRLGAGFSVMLLHGVTGSGKTEIYVRAIRSVLAQGKQAILLVPEIALATQTLSRLLQRLPRVAVLHSGLTDVQRAFYYDQIRDGHAAVVVGPRSALFAPCRSLGLIIVDEEHEPTYKQDVAPRYHGRDTAVMRGSVAGVPVILGSATPSLESLANAQAGRYELLSLPRRVRGLPMPKLQIVQLRREMQPGKVELLGRTLTHKMAGALDRGEQIILLLNRRGYASYVFCPSCGWTMFCDNCTRAMVFHQATAMGMCHYCQHTEMLPEACPACRKKLLLFGYGIQRIEAELARKFPDARVARMDSDTMTSPSQFRRVFDEFAGRQLDILLGTQMVAKGLDFPGVSLVGVVSADTSLSIPDFRASERTFQLIVQVAGRAGRAGLAGEVVVQTLLPDEPAIVFASQHDYAGFAAGELPNRQSIGLPPYGRMVRVVVRHEDGEKTDQSASLLHERLRRLLPPEVTISVPTPCGVRKINNQFRWHILMQCAKAGLVQQYMMPNMDALLRDIPAEVIADVDPVQLM